MKETLRHREAFEYYYSLGPDRSLRCVAGECKVSEKSVAAWSRAFDWQARVEQRDMENAKRLQQKTDDTVVSAKAKYRKIVQGAIAEFVNRLKAGNVEINSIADLERLVKLDLLLIGEATETMAHKHSFEGVTGLAALSDGELAQRMAECVEALATRDTGHALPGS